MKDKVVTILTFSFLNDAVIAKSILEDNEIPCFLSDQLTNQVNPFQSNMAGGLRLEVLEKDIDKAKELLKKVRSKEIPQPEIEVTVLSEDTDRNCCPFCSSENIIIEKKPAGINWLSLFIAGLPTPINKNGYHCFDCGKKWKFNKS